MSITRQLVTMGGGGFSMEPQNPLLDNYIISLSAKKSPKICFIATASGDSPSYIEKFYTNMQQHQVRAIHLSLFNAPLGSLHDFVMDQDIFYVGGGNTRNMLVLWKEWQLDQLLKQAYQQGAILAGLSAGSICWYQQGVTDSIPGELNSLACLGILAGSNCPHYDGEAERRPAYHRLIQQGMSAGIACDDGVAAYYQNEKIIEYVSAKPNAKAYSVEAVNKRIHETELATRYLG